MAKTTKKKVSVKKIEKKPEPEKVAPPKEEVIENINKPEPAPEPEKVEALPAALPSEVAKDIVTSKATKTTVKFCGKWFHLVKGRAVTATANQIAYLRSCGLVE